jgi:hypothetical protein
MNSRCVGRIDRLGEGVTTLHVGERDGVGWIHSSSRVRSENLNPAFVATCRDVDGGCAS